MFTQYWPNHVHLNLRGIDYFRVVNSHGWPLSIAVRATRLKGNLCAAIETSNLLERFKPSFAFLCGIAGNLNHSKHSLGDVVISDRYRYQWYSRMTEGKKLKKSSEERQVRSSRMQDIVNREFFAVKRANPFRGKNPEFGKIFCWDMVLDCDESRQEIIEFDNDLVAVEMESAGFISAVESFNQQRQFNVGPLVFRGLSDPATGKRESDLAPKGYREMAAHNTAEALAYFIDNLKKDDCEPY